MEFHISRHARQRYQFDLSLFSLSGNVIFANFHAARLFAQKMNQQRNLVQHPETAIKASQINALGLLDEILHHLIARYRREKNPQVMRKALTWLELSLGAPEVERTLIVFANEFPPLAVYQGRISLHAYLEQTTEGIPNREVLLEEMLLLWVTNQNPATEPYRELFDDQRLKIETAYAAVFTELQKFFEIQPRFGSRSLTLIDLLLGPARAHPGSLLDQLAFLREEYVELLGEYLFRLLSSLDFIKEEEKPVFFGPGPVQIPLGQADFAAPGDVEAFSPDRDWMPRLVMIAKNAYVWLDQLSKKYQRPIQRLDQIPDEELDTLARWGFTGLWLIGLWERSRASAQIKQMCGNPEAIASAYSLFSYQIAADLGGDEACDNLRSRAWQRGIRLASDMVPNHMGIDSPWVVEHPDWFISLDHSPYPSYNFNTPDLSADSRVSVHLEEHYFNRTDAAVVFKLYDHRNGQERYIYHGNDGTSMPWNDTAQLNYLNPEVREAVIQTILSVARRFPIIRFDAAMTLAKKHLQRLWYPEPGSGGDIPSRAEHGMSKEQFDQLVPAEFWREVVDRIAAEQPDTLLLAEAFWLMESYFVRTLGMHRVYNSAFMNLLRNEENAKFRMLNKNTLEFEPEILKRFVNFMNNPDERTAEDQFGRGDKYFGICTLLVTQPGLPMFGHGQMEGFTEKYGMEYRRAYLNEQPDTALVERHERQITPLIHMRRLFAGVEQYLLYDFTTPAGTVDENVLVYSNGLGNEHALVVYHNQYASTQGWVRTSVPVMQKDANGERRLVQRSLGEALNLSDDENTYCMYLDHVSGLEYIRPSRQLKYQGLFLELGAYQHHVLLHFRQVKDDASGSYCRLYQNLAGRGVHSITEALQELDLQPILQPFQELIRPDFLRRLIETLSAHQPAPQELVEETQYKMLAVLSGIESMTGNSPARLAVEQMCLSAAPALFQLPRLAQTYPLPGARRFHAALEALQGSISRREQWATLLGWVFTRSLGCLSPSEDPLDQTLSWLSEWRLLHHFEQAIQKIGLDAGAAARAAQTVRVLLLLERDMPKFFYRSPAENLSRWLSEEQIQRLLGFNRYEDVLWYNREAFEEFLVWVNLVAAWTEHASPTGSASGFVERLILAREILDPIAEAQQGSDYQVLKLLEALKPAAG